MTTQRKQTNLNRNLKLLRKHTGKSQEQLCATLGIKRSTYSQYENASIEPCIGLIVRIAAHYKATVEMLWNEPLNDEQVKELLGDG